MICPFCSKLMDDYEAQYGTCRECINSMKNIFSIDENSQADFRIVMSVTNSYGAKVYNTEFHDCSIPVESLEEAKQKLENYISKIRG